MLKAADEPSRLSVPAIVASAYVFLLQYNHRLIDMYLFIYSIELWD